MPRLTPEPKRPRLEDEGGFTLVFVALLLIILMVFAAFVVDIGGVYSMRRDDQNAADVAALAAVHELIGSPDTREARIVATVKQQAHTALGHTLTDAEWDSCPPGGNDPGEDPGVLLNQISTANCISWNPIRVRVRLPDQYWDTSFGVVVGREEIRHSAFAVAGLEPEGFGGVLPFAVTGDSAQGGLGCLKSNSNGQASALCGSTTGNFGYLDFSFFGNASLNTVKSCGSGDTGPRIEANTAMGVDHQLSLANTVHVNPIADTDACQSSTEYPDAANTETGNMEDRISRGMFYKKDTPMSPVYADGKPARLQRSDSDLLGGAGRRVNDVAGVDDLDDNALWLFIPAATGPDHNGADFPVSCQRDQFVTSTDSYYSDITTNPNLNDEVAEFLSDLGTREQMIALLNRCFQHYRGEAWDGTPVGSFEVIGGGNEAPTGCDADGTAGCTAPVFGVDTDTTEDPNIYDIQRTSRFGYVPVISDFPNGTDKRAFLRFRAIYIQRLVIEQNGNKYLFDPGFGPTYGPFTTDADEARDVTDFQRVGETLVFVFPDGMLPGRLADADAPFDLGVNYFPELIR